MKRSNLAVANLKVRCIAVAFLVSAVPAYAQSSAPEATEIAATVQRFRGALAQGDPKVAMEMLAPDAVILESGAMQTREEYAREHLAEDIAFAKATSSTRLSLNVRQEGKAAWTMSTYRTSGSFEGKPIDSIGAELAVLTQTPDGWRIRSIHWSSHAIKKID